MTVKSENIAALNPYVAIDALARFVVLLLKTMKSDESFTAASILKIAQKVFSVVSVVLVFAHEKTQVRFDQKPFFRFFSSLLNDLKEFQFDMQNIYYSVLCLFSNTLFSLSPQKVPGFSFSWVQLLCHRNFLPPLLLCDNQKCWPFFHKLLVEYFTFLAPQLQHSNLNNTSRVLYRATLRILLILLHDFPEFLTSYHHSLVNAIPVNCIQLRNLILSAFPTDMRLPDPFTPNLKVDLLPEINQAPKMLSNYTQILIDLDIKTNLDKFLEKRTPASYPNSISKHFLNKNPVVGNKYNVPLINSFVLYTGIFDILQSQEKNDQGAPQVTPNSPVTDLYQRVLAELEPEGTFG
jgi:CCR4-NOT transcription complex subunit 1